MIANKKKRSIRMVTVLECIMLICFGISWPISVYKSATSHSTQGKSVVFTFAIMTGYVAGIAGKILDSEINYVLALYILNLIVVSVDCVLYFVNRRREKMAQGEPKHATKFVFANEEA